jgi:acylphosphatase
MRPHEDAHTVMKAEKLSVVGRVQNVDYRRFVMELAREAGLAGTVKNEQDGSVTIFAQGDPRKLDHFVLGVGRPAAPAAVKSVLRSAAKAKPELKHFSIQSRGLAEEIQEGFGAMQSEFADYRKDFADYRSEFKDYREEFIGFAQRTDENFRFMSEKYGEISTKPTVLLETLQKESADTRSELKRSVDNLARLVDEYIARGKQ